MKRIFKRRRLIVFCNDISMAAFAWVMTVLFCFDASTRLVAGLFCLPIVLLVQAWSFYFCGLYRGIWRFASIPDLVRIIQAVLINVFCLALLLNVEQMPLTFFQAPIIYGILLLFFLSGPRLLFRWFQDYKPSFLGYDRVLIVGAGSAAESIVRDLRRLRLQGYRPVAFVDDDSKKQGQEIHGIRVKGTCADIPKLVDALQIQLCIIAMPSASSAEVRRIIGLCEQVKVRFCTLPSIRELAEGRISVNALREVSLHDLLGREEVNLEEDNIQSFIQDKVIAVSGGGGSIGSELCLQLAYLKPKTLIVIDHSEFNLYSIDMKLHDKYPELHLKTVLSNVTDRIAMEQLFIQHRPQVFFHAAAYKHVPMLESQLRSAMHNNIVGTRVLAEMAVNYQCGAFILISTDKAVNPENIMGATKRASEVLCQSYDQPHQTRFMTVRFGNVLDSAGSVIPLFRKQLAEGGPLTVTHPDITRFFMTIPEAAQLIIQASKLGKGGEIFVLDMGDPIKIKYLAEKLITFSGKQLDRDISIKYTGLRAGEKLYEELFYQEEALNVTSHPKIRQAQSKKRTGFALLSVLNEIEAACQINDEKKLLQLLCELVPEYHCKHSTVNEKDSLQLTYSY